MFFYFFSHPHFLKPILASLNWHIGFCPHAQSQPFGKIQRANFSTALIKSNEIKA
jgi:hypothetical protein